MKKNRKTLIILLVLVVLVGGSALALYLTQPAGEDADASSAAPVSSSPALSLISREAGDVQEIKIDNGLMWPYTVIPLAEEVVSQAEASASAAPEVQFTIRQIDSFDPSVSQVTAMAKSLLSLNAARDLGAQDDLAQYGLQGEETVEVTLTYNDGTTDELLIGGKPGESPGRYVLKDGSVYIVSGISEQIFSEPYDFISKSLISIPGKEVKDDEGNVTGEENILEVMTLSGTNFAEEIRIEHAPEFMAQYAMTAPMRADASSAKLEEIITALKTVTADRVAQAGVAKAPGMSELLAEFDLLEPFAVVEYTINGETHTIQVSGKNEDGNRYMRVIGLDLIYEIAADKVAIWAEAGVMDLRSSYIFLPNINDVKRLTLGYDGTDTVLDVTRTEDEEKSTEETPAYILTVKSGEGDVSYKDVYQPFYAELISLAVLSPDRVDYARENPVLTVKYEYFGGAKSDELAFYEIDGQADRYAAERNGEFMGILRKSSIDGITGKIADVAANTGATESSEPAA